MLASTDLLPFTHPVLHLRSNPASSHSWLRELVFSCCITNDHRPNGIRQQLHVLSKFLWVGSLGTVYLGLLLSILHGQVVFSPGGSGEASTSKLTHAVGCYMTEVLISLLAVSQGPLSASREWTLRCLPCGALKRPSSLHGCLLAQGQEKTLFHFQSLPIRKGL